MNYIDELAHRIRSLVPRHDLPDDDTRDLFRSYAVLALAKGDRVDGADVHNAWSAWMLRTQPDHESIVPFSRLAADVADADAPFVQAIHDAVRQTR